MHARALALLSAFLLLSACGDRTSVDGASGTGDSGTTDRFDPWGTCIPGSPPVPEPEICLVPGVCRSGRTCWEDECIEERTCETDSDCLDPPTCVDGTCRALSCAATCPDGFACAGEVCDRVAHTTYPCEENFTNRVEIHPLVDRFDPLADYIGVHGGERDVLVSWRGDQPVQVFELDLQGVAQRWSIDDGVTQHRGVVGIHDEVGPPGFVSWGDGLAVVRAPWSSPSVHRIPFDTAIDTVVPLSFGPTPIPALAVVTAEANPVVHLFFLDDETGDWVEADETWAIEPGNRLQFSMDEPKACYVRLFTDAFEELRLVPGGEVEVVPQPAMLEDISLIAYVEARNDWRWDDTRLSVSRSNTLISDVFRYEDNFLGATSIWRQPFPLEHFGRLRVGSGGKFGYDEAGDLHVVSSCWKTIDGNGPIHDIATGNFVGDCVPEMFSVTADGLATVVTIPQLGGLDCMPQ